MKISIGFILWSLLIALVSGGRVKESNTAEVDYKVVCYYGAWASYRTGDGNFQMEDIDPNLCTHLIYSFAGVDYQTFKMRILDPQLDTSNNGGGHNGFKRVLALKSLNPNLKVLIAVGGFNEGSYKYSVMAADPNKRRIFIESAVEFISSYGFDGLDLDWEWPANRGGAMTDFDSFPVLLNELRQEMDKYNWLLTVAVGVAPTHMLGYDVEKVANYVHFVNLMTYDLRGSWDGKTAHHTQLYPMPTDVGTEAQLNLKSCVMAWIDGGAPPHKLILGTAFYGKSYTTVSANNDGSLGQPTSGSGTPGPFTGEAGKIGYNEMCLKLKDESGWQEDTNKYVLAPWAFKDNQWIAFDNVKSIIAKSEWAKNELGLGGGMTWSIDTDDFRGNCHNGQKYPLLNALYSTWTGNGTKIQIPTHNPEITFPTDHNNVETTVKTTTTTTTSPVSVTTNAYCPTVGEYKSDDLDCSKYYVCSPSASGGGYWVQGSCGTGLYFNPDILTCDYPSNVQCNNLK